LFADFPTGEKPAAHFGFRIFKNRNGGFTLTTINLRDFYPLYYDRDQFIDVPENVAAALADAERTERNYARRVYRNRGHYSLDAGDGIANDIRAVSLSPEELYERKLTTEQLHASLAALPAKQGQRVYAHYILGVSKAEIARREGVAKSRVSDSIGRGLRNMQNILKNFC
jgi:RNA polymerase sigma-70 factor (ECF subfamily)